MRMQDFLQKLRIARNTSWRGDCPKCGGNNTLSVNNESGKLKYHCFRNSCGIKGISSVEMSLEDIKTLTNPKETTSLSLSRCIGWDSNIKAYSKVMQYLDKNNCLEAYACYPNRFFYDKVKNRVVFVEYEGLNSFKLATGRGLDGEFPKWYKYISLAGTYFLQNPSCNLKTSAYIVEDCASACAISRLGWGIALCGTSYNTPALVNTILKTGASSVTILLDKDAQNKAKKLQIDVQAFGKFKSVKIALLSDDAKYLSADTIKKELINV